MSSLRKFDIAWSELEEEGLVERYRCAQYASLLQDWVINEKPNDIHSFLLGRYPKANQLKKSTEFEKLFKLVWKLFAADKKVPSVSSREYASAFDSWRKLGRYHRVASFIIEWVETEKLFQKS